MARYSRRKKHSRRHSSLRSVEITARTQSDTGRRSAGLSQVREQRSAKRAGGSNRITAFLRSHIKAVAIAVFVLVVGGIVLGIVLGGKNTAPAVGDAENNEVAVLPSNSPGDDYSEYTEETGYDYDGVDESVLAGLTGSDESLFTEDEEMQEAIFAAEGIRIGVTIEKLNGNIDELYLGKLEQTSFEYEEGRLVYEVYYYNAQGDFNQQLQDVRSLIKNEVDVIIIGSTTKENFNMILGVAQDAGIPVVAYNAPVGVSGYEVNVVTDDKEWGKAYGQFMAENLQQGKVLQVLGSVKDSYDLLRAEGIQETLTANGNLRLEDIIYAGWDEDDAHDAVLEYLDEEGYVDGIITEEGMAKGILDAYIEMQRLPKVMCGDIYAGFIKTWYQLKTSGIELTIEPEDDDEDPVTVVFKAKTGEMTVLAKPAPLSIGSVAFEIAYNIANGRTLKTSGKTLDYSPYIVITNQNLAKYYGMVMNEEDDYLLRDAITQEILDSLFNPEENTETEE